MNYQFPGFTIAFIISAVMNLVSAFMVWRRRLNPGSIPFIILMLYLIVNSVGSIFEAGAISASQKMFWGKWQYLGMIPVGPLYLMFTTQYTKRERVFPSFLKWAIWIIPFVTAFLTFTNESHHLIWTDLVVQKDNYFIGLYSHGLVYYVHVVFSYICLLVGTIWMIKEMAKGEKSRRLQTIVFILTVGIGWAANILYNLNVFIVPGFDMTTITISLISLVLAWTISRYRVFDLVPIAKKSLLASMQEGVIVIDPNDIVLEVNPAALRITQYDGPSPVGQSVWEVFNKYIDQIEPLRNKTDFVEEMVFQNHSKRTIEIQVTSITKAGEEHDGQLIVLRDITADKWAEEKETEQREFVEVLADTAAVINRTLELDEVLERILENVVKVVPHDSANIALMTGQGQAKFVRVTNQEKYKQMDYLTGLDLNVMSIKNFRTMAETGKPLIVADTRADGQWTNSLEESKWIRSFLGAPIIHQGELLGFINLDSDKENFFSEKHAERLNIFTEYAATAISNARNYAEVKYYGEEMAILYEISLAIAAGVGLEKTTQAVFRQLKRVIPVDFFYLALYEPETHMVSYFMYKGDGTRVPVEPFNLFQKKSMTRYVIEKKERVYIPDFLAEDAELKENQVILIPNYDGRSALGIPLILRGTVIGVLSVQSRKVDAYSSRQIQLVETIAQQATIAMDNARLFERMQELAITDGLTHLYNRRYFYMVLENEIERTLRYETPLSLIMMDVDHFKAVNDQFGHLAGDTVLEALAGLCKGLLRQADEMFRYGGEEFTIILPETSLEMAMTVADRVRTVIETSTFDIGNESVSITASLGVAQFESGKCDLNAFVEAADSALYRAKQSGRNCVQTNNDLPEGKIL